MMHGNVNFNIGLGKILWFMIGEKGVVHLKVAIASTPPRESAEWGPSALGDRYQLLGVSDIDKGYAVLESTQDTYKGLFGVWRASGSCFSKTPEVAAGVDYLW